MNNLHKRNRGFTLIEILIVLAILAGVVVMLTRSTGDAASKAKARQALADINILVNQIKEELAADNLSGDSATAATKIVNDKNDKVKDPWGNMYDIAVAGGTITVKLGANSTAINSNDDLHKDIKAANYFTGK